MATAFRPGVDRVLYAQAVFGEEEIAAVTDCLRQGWLGPGRITEEFERGVAAVCGKKFGLFVNSGSTANYIAMEIAGLPRGSEVITQACTFPATLNPIIMHGHTPVFLDSKVGSYNLDLDQLDAAIGPKTKAIFISHALGNVNDVVRIRELCDRHRLCFIEDGCDTLGQRYRGEPTGRWSHLSTASFYAAHHITTAGGGGMVMTDDPKLIREAKIFRDWGRALPENDDENIAERFNFQVGGSDFDGKFTYVKIALNFKPVEVQAAFGLVQLRRLAEFNRIRQRNIQRLTAFFEQYQAYFLLPQTLPQAEVYLISYPLTIKPGCGIVRKDLLTYLEQHRIQTRLVFAGNILHHPAYRGITARVVGGLEGADTIMRHSFLIGCHQGLTDAHLDYLTQTFADYLRERGFAPKPVAVRSAASGV